jgi:hypothetical protein
MPMSSDAAGDLIAIRRDQNGEEINRVVRLDTRAVKLVRPPYSRSVPSTSTCT